MPPVNVNRKAANVQAFQLTTPEEMVSALKFLSGRGYTGHINQSQAGGGAVWDIAIQNATVNVAQSGKIGDWIAVENNSIATILSPTDFANLYTQA